MIPSRGLWMAPIETLRLAPNVRGQSCFASTDSEPGGTSISNEGDDCPSAAIQRLMTAASDDQRAASNRLSKNPRYNLVNARSQLRKHPPGSPSPLFGLGRSAGSGRRTALGANRTPSKIRVQCSRPDAIINPAFRGHLPFFNPGVPLASERSVGTQPLIATRFPGNACPKPQ